MPVALACSARTADAETRFYVVEMSVGAKPVPSNSSGIRELQAQVKQSLSLSSAEWRLLPEQSKASIVPSAARGDTAIT
ncbi:hypothetical protein [Methylobacterium indicum]|uniref:hypothetical protein n=1 Tax=Methylobacterium indicum TaxID=1775910 RepID=UPI000A63E97A|nr:hypothetical protein [Methylobacterium indicum]